MTYIEFVNQKKSPHHPTPWLNVSVGEVLIFILTSYWCMVQVQNLTLRNLTDLTQGELSIFLQFFYSFNHFHIRW